MKLDQLCIDLVDLKNQQEGIKKQIFKLEQEIECLLPSDKFEGTSSTKLDKFKVSVTRKLTRTLDYEAYQAMDLPIGHQFVDLKPTINLKRLRAVEQVDPGVVEAVVTVKPAKSTIKIEVITDGN